MTERTLSPAFVTVALAALNTVRAVTTNEVAMLTCYHRNYVAAQLKMMAARGLILQTAKPYGPKNKRKVRPKQSLWEPIPPTRTCAACGHEGPETDFYPDLKRGTGFYTGCRMCRRSKYSRELELRAAKRKKVAV